jgi:hypothetical protein
MVLFKGADHDNGLVIVLLIAGRKCIEQDDDVSFVVIRIRNT